MRENRIADRGNCSALPTTFWRKERADRPLVGVFDERIFLPINFLRQTFSNSIVTPDDLTADRVMTEYDFGGTTVTSMHVSCVAELRDYFGLEKIRRAISGRAIGALLYSYVNRIVDRTLSGCRQVSGISVSGEIVPPWVRGKPRESRGLLERAGIQRVKVPFHFEFDLIQRCFKDQSYILFMILAPLCQRNP